MSRGRQLKNTQQWHNGDFAKAEGGAYSVVPQFILLPEMLNVTVLKAFVIALFGVYHRLVFAADKCERNLGVPPTHSCIFTIELQYSHYRRNSDFSRFLIEYGWCVQYEQVFGQFFE